MLMIGCLVQQLQPAMSMILLPSMLSAVLWKGLMVLI
uniref:Kinesin-like protein n=1 Tax=Rhizophora mucronata TaxID=61149 RepID=A0A2P2LDM8_RHIMU